MRKHKSARYQEGHAPFLLLILVIAAIISLILVVKSRLNVHPVLRRVAVSVTPSPSANPLEGWTTYTYNNPKYGYHVMSPPGWVLQKIDDTNTDYGTIDIYAGDESSGYISFSVEPLMPPASVADEIKADMQYLDNTQQDTVVLPVGTVNRISGILNAKNDASDLGKHWQSTYYVKDNAVYRSFLIQPPDFDYTDTYTRFLQTFAPITQIQNN